MPDLFTRRPDLQTESYSWGTLQWLCSAKLLPGAHQTLGWCEILPGKENPLHFHPNCEELLHVLTGTGRHLIGDDWVALSPGVTIRVPVGVVHKLINDGADVLRCIIAFSSGERETVFLENVT